MPKVVSILVCVWISNVTYVCESCGHKLGGIHSQLVRPILTYVRHDSFLRET